MAANGGFIVGDEESQPTKITYNPHASTPMNHHHHHSTIISDQLKKCISFTKSISGSEQRKIDSHQLSLRERLGLDDLFTCQIWRASLSELFGTATLVFMIDTIAISSYQSNLDAPKLVMSVLMVITVALLVLATVPVSGGHINPTVSVSAGLVGVISLSRATIYIFAQCTGAILGALVLKAVVSSDIERKYSLGGCTVTVIAPGPDGPITTGLPISQALGLEIVCSFAFLFASRWIALDQRQAKMVGRVIVCSAIGLAAGLNTFVSTTVTGAKGYSGAGMNPARCLGPAIVRGGHLWDGHWVFWVGPFTASVSFYLYTKIIPGPHFRPEEYKHDFFHVLKAIFTSNDIKINVLE